MSDDEWAKALEGATLTDQINVWHTAYRHRKRCEDVAVDKTVAVVTACDRCDAQPLIWGYATRKGDLCVECAAEVRCGTGCRRPPAR